MRRNPGIMRGRQSADKLCTDLHQCLPRIGTCITRWLHLVFRVFRGLSVISGGAIRHLLTRRHGFALTHAPGDVLHVLHEAVETRTAERNLAAAAVENSRR